MCLYTRQILPIRAKKDITCYKALRPVSFYNADSTIGHAARFETPFTKTPVNVPGTLIPGRCFLRFPLYQNSYSRHFYFGHLRTYTVDKGFIHAYTGQRKAAESLGFPFVVAECTIPKGTLYFISHDKEEICAKQLILNYIV